MDIIPSDLATFGSEAKNLLQDLQSRNERMFLLTFLVVNMADTKRKLDNDVFATAGFAQKNNCALTRLDYLQEAGFMSSIPLGENLIPIQRGLTTSSTAIFIPFMRLTPQELTAMLAGGGIPGIAPMPADYDEQEDNADEE